MIVFYLCICFGFYGFAECLWSTFCSVFVVLHAINYVSKYELEVESNKGSLVQNHDAKERHIWAVIWCQRRRLKSRTMDFIGTRLRRLSFKCLPYGMVTPKLVIIYCWLGIHVPMILIVETSRNLVTFWGLRIACTRECKRLRIMKWTNGQGSLVNKQHN